MLRSFFAITRIVQNGKEDYEALRRETILKQVLNGNYLLLTIIIIFFRGVSINYDENLEI